jgi:hypothetical protein
MVGFAACLLNKLITIDAQIHVMRKSTPVLRVKDPLAACKKRVSFLIGI